ncbi:MAG: gliding motility-associated C-terminal domain-containing protein, partial [Bacteroidia bacterium]|nr:gliding motility-associated C-terminal domain-containing protein [Bacteroidia bacterium]
AGTYTINVSDAGGCVGTNTLTITQPASSITAVMSTTAASCGSSNGVASVSASGGTTGYTYNWTPSGGTSATASGLSSGNYSVTITDANSCTLTAIANITSANGPTLSVSSQTNVNCFGTNTGTATVAGTGGTGPYTYTWMPGNLSGASQTNLTAGTYTINVSDAGGCVGTNTLTITQPVTGLSGVITNSPTGCGNSVGSATVTVSGGTPTYSYSWSPTSSNSNSISGLGVGNVSVLVMDNNGCTISFSTTINSSGTGPTLSISSQTNVNCTNANSGAATINTSGTGPYTYSWVPTGGNTVTATGLGAGNYTVFVSDAALCTSTIAVTITQSPSLGLNVASTNASCMDNDGEASVTISGGTAPTTILWSNNNTTSTISGLSTGSYSVLVTDANGCTASGITNIISAGTLTVNISADVTIMEGQSTPLLVQVPANANVFWTPAEGLSCTNCPNPIASPTVTTEYCALSIVGTCTNTSCTDVTVKIDCSSNSDYSTPNAFTPNGDGINDEFCLKGWKKCINTFYIAIYNRWGEKVYDSDDADFCWDGKFRGTLLNAGVFVFYIKASLDDGSNITRKGNINLIR